MHEDMVLTKQEPCQLMPRIMRVVESLPRGPCPYDIFGETPGSFSY
jgi:hypothetical protein